MLVFVLELRYQTDRVVLCNLSWAARLSLNAASCRLQTLDSDVFAVYYPFPSTAHMLNLLDRSPLHVTSCTKARKKKVTYLRGTCLLWWWVCIFSQSVTQSVHLQLAKPRPSVFCQMLKSASLSKSSGDRKRLCVSMSEQLKKHTLSKSVRECQFAG